VKTKRKLVTTKLSQVTTKLSQVHHLKFPEILTVVFINGRIAML